MSIAASLQTIPFKQNSFALFVPDEGAVKEAWKTGNINFPYWSKVWPSAVALSEFLLQRPFYVQNKRVLEIGGGLGLPSLIAARYATEVLCTDYAAEATELAAQSANHHRLQNFSTAVVDWQSPPLNFKPDVLLLSDVNYEPVAFKSLKAAVENYLCNGTTVIITTPHRLMAKEFITSLMLYCIHQESITVVVNEQDVTISLFVLRQ